VIDDHSRAAYAETHAEETAATTHRGAVTSGHPEK
jgi:hypothetical protein